MGRRRRGRARGGKKRGEEGEESKGKRSRGGEKEKEEGKKKKGEEGREIIRKERIMGEEREAIFSKSGLTAGVFHFLIFSKKL